MIEIAFDYGSDLHSVISESITVDFGFDDEWVLMRAVFNNISAKDFVLSNDIVLGGRVRL